MLAKKRKFIFGILGILLCFNILAWLVVCDFSQNKFLEVNFFNIGQGDAIFIETQKLQQILIDGGPGSVILERLDKEMSFWDRTIDLVILTHPEKDHLSGLLEVLKRYKVENILWTGIVRDTSEYKEWLKSIRDEKAKITIAQANQKIILSRTDTDGFIQVLFPFENLEGKVFENSNDASIVSRLVFDKNSFLFTGDISKTTEKKILEKGIDLDSDILKVSHHGSRTSSDENFIKRISPKVAVIQAGKDNSYGHPHKETLETLEKYGIIILRNDINGNIKIISDGKNYISNLQN